MNSYNTRSPAPPLLGPSPISAPRQAAGPAQSATADEITKRLNGNDDVRSGAGTPHDQTAYLARDRRSRIHRLQSPGSPPQAGSAGGRAGQFFPGEAG